MQLKSSTEPSRGELLLELQFLSERLEALKRRVETSSDLEALLTDPTDLGDVNNLLAAREARGRFFNPDLFVQTAWDIIVVLYLADLQQRQVTASHLYSVVGGAPTTGIRWTDRLIKEGLVTKSSDPNDGRRIFLNLTDDGRRSMQSYLASLRGTVPI
jgi:DNA-binding MarR family transcriptional regulator